MSSKPTWCKHVSSERGINREGIELIPCSKASNAASSWVHVTQHRSEGTTWLYIVAFGGEPKASLIRICVSIHATVNELTGGHLLNLYIHIACVCTCMDTIISIDRASANTCSACFPSFTAGRCQMPRPATPHCREASWALFRTELNIFLNIN